MKCNHDCFNCQYPDCIEDDLTTDDYKSNEVEQFIQDKPSEREIKQRELSRNRMRSKRAADPEFNKRYYTEHREQEIKRNSEAKKKNREYYNTYQRERYARNREEMCRKRREYRARLRERQAG
jgi:hypothetical protein